MTNGNGLNQLKKVTAPNGTLQEYTYDQHSRVSSMKETVDGLTFTTSYTYDNFGRVKDITYPAGLTVSHTYNGHGHLTTVTAGGTPIYTLGAWGAVQYAWAEVPAEHTPIRLRGASLSISEGGGNMDSGLFNGSDPSVFGTGAQQTGLMTSSCSD